MMFFGVVAFSMALDDKNKFDYGASCQLQKKYDLISRYKYINEKQLLSKSFSITYPQQRIVLLLTPISLLHLTPHRIYLLKL